jgi:hypothetical protein
VSRVTGSEIQSVSIVECPRGRAEAKNRHSKTGTPLNPPSVWPVVRMVPHIFDLSEGQRLGNNRSSAQADAKTIQTALPRLLTGVCPHPHCVGCQAGSGSRRAQGKGSALLSTSALPLAT